MVQLEQAHAASLIIDKFQSNINPVIGNISAPLKVSYDQCIERRTSLRRSVENEGIVRRIELIFSASNGPKVKEKLSMRNSYPSLRRTCQPPI